MIARGACYLNPELSEEVRTRHYVYSPDLKTLAVSFRIILADDSGELPDFSRMDSE